jgi:hypothetical protein
MTRHKILFGCTQVRIMVIVSVRTQRLEDIHCLTYTKYIQDNHKWQKTHAWIPAYIFTSKRGYALSNAVRKKQRQMWESSFVTTTKNKNKEASKRIKAQNNTDVDTTAQSFPLNSESVWMEILGARINLTLFSLHSQSRLTSKRLHMVYHVTLQADIITAFLTLSTWYVASR